MAGGKDVLFVGTKRQARHAIEEESKRCGMHYVNERWLGGTLTNFRTIRHRLNRLEELEKLWATGQIDTYSKKMKATLQREMDKIKANLEGIRKMERMPGVMFIIDTRREHIAVKEARKLGVPTIALIDTDSDPDLIDLPIPGNDDAMRAIEIICKELADSDHRRQDRPNARRARRLPPAPRRAAAHRAPRSAPTRARKARKLPPKKPATAAAAPTAARIRTSDSIIQWIGDSG